MQEFLSQFWQNLGSTVPNLIGAILVLFVGWLVALIISAAIRAILSRTTVDDRIAASMGLGKGQADFQVEPIVSKIVFWIIMLFVFVAFFQLLGLTVVTEPLNNLLSQVVGFGSNLIGAAVLIFLAWVLATAAHFVIVKILGATKVDDKLSTQAGLTQEDQPPLSTTLANVLYWFIILLFLPAILGALNMQGLLSPVQDMVGDVLGYLPNIFGAGLAILVGWFVARIIRQVVVGLLVAAGVDNLGSRIGMTAESGDQTLSGLIGLIVYVLIFIPALIAGLEILGISAISDPATEMLSSLMLAIPALFGAGIILVVTYFIAKLVSGIVTGLLKGIGFDKILNLIGVGNLSEDAEWTPSEIVGYLVMVILMLFAAIEAANLLGFGIFADLVAQFIEFAFQIVVALIIFGLGLFLANLAYRVVMSTARIHTTLMAQSARIVIIIFVAAMALRQVGVAEDIVNLAFGLSLGAIAIAFALAFGLGSRELAGREMEGVVNKLRSSGEAEEVAEATE